MNPIVEFRTPTVEEYQILRGTTNWDKIDDSLIATALINTKFCVCITDGCKVIAMGRIIGDGIYFYIQDVIVLPSFKRKGIGSRVMQELENWLDNTSQPNTFIGLMAAKGTFEFYQNFDYGIRDTDKPGMFKIKKPG